MKTTPIRPFLFATLGALIFAAPLHAAVPAQALKETVEIVTRKFGRESLEGGTKAFTKRLEEQAMRYGKDNVLKAVSKVGPSAMRTAAMHGDEAGAVYRVFAKYGSDAARICDDPKLAQLFIKYGDEAAEAMIKHPGVASGVITTFGDEGAHALVALGRTNAGRLALLQDGLLATSPAHRGLLGVIGRHGDRALDFIWRHKGILITAAVVTAFVSDPEPYLDGLRELGADVAGTVVGKVGESANMNFVAPLTVTIVVAGALLFWGLRFGFGGHVAALFKRRAPGGS